MSDKPKVVYCPYCGSALIKFVGDVPRCMTCRAVFFVDFSRYTRKSPSRNNPTY